MRKGYPGKRVKVSSGLIIRFQKGFYIKRYMVDYKATQKKTICVYPVSFGRNTGGPNSLHERGRDSCLRAVLCYKRLFTKACMGSIGFS